MRVTLAVHEVAERVAMLEAVSVVARPMKTLMQLWQQVFQSHAEPGVYTRDASLDPEQER